jgi:hypothetical protein
LEFADVFNTGTHPQDQRHLSTYMRTPTGDHVVKSTYPVSLRDFHIVPEQCGLAVPRHTSLTEDQASVFQEYATVMASQTKRRREAFQIRDDKRRKQFYKSSGPKKGKNNNNRYNPYGHSAIDLCDSESNHSFSVNPFEEHPRASTSHHTPEPSLPNPAVSAQSVNYYNSEPDQSLIPDFDDALVNLVDETAQEILQPMETQE